MKKTVLMILAGATWLLASAQNEKFTSAMEQKLSGYDTIRSSESLQDAANAFERIAETEKTQWLPYYYAALSNVNLGFNYAFAAGPMGGNSDKVDPLADKAEALLAKAEALSKDNSEIWVVKKMIATLRMMGDVMTRFMTYGPMASDAIDKAKQLNPNNPRVYVLEGVDKFQTPEQFGGSKSEAKILFEKAAMLYDTTKPESTIHPTWGRSTLNYFMSQIK
jgi:hypothetical protein